jgi:tRNA(adenine34) deaminase
MPGFLDKLRARWSKPAAPTAPVSDLDLSMMHRALGLAQAAAAMGEVPVGALVYRTTTGEVLGEAHNRRESDKDPSAHAEHMAMVSASRTLKDWRLTGCSLAVTLEPCPMCAGLIVNSRIDRVIYGAKDPKAGAMGSLMNLTEDPRLNHRVTPIAGVLADESAALLKDFFRKLRSQK